MTELKTTFLKDYIPPSFLINRVELTFKLNENLTQVNSMVDFYQIATINLKVMNLVFFKYPINLILRLKIELNLKKIQH